MRASDGRRREAGQSTTEMMLMTSFLTLFIVGAVHLCMFAITRHMTDYAAFAASRAVMVHGANPDDVTIPIIGELRLVIGVDIPLDFRLQSGWPAARAVLSVVNWSGDWRGWPSMIGGGRRVMPDGRLSEDDNWLWVTHRVPWGMPIVNELPEGGMPVRGYARYVIQDVGEGGDNAR
jgi:hypothetical protein